MQLFDIVASSGPIIITIPSSSLPFIHILWIQVYKETTGYRIGPYQLHDKWVLGVGGTCRKKKPKGSKKNVPTTNPT